MNRQLIAGVDEVGRGALAGPVIAAAVILNPELPVAGLADSKKISAEKRNKLASELREKSLAWAIGRAEPEEIDSINILQASLLAMQRAINTLSIKPQRVFVDGIYGPSNIAAEVDTIVKGDSKIPVISAASIIAKVTRDLEMVALDAAYPGYGFARHKGYPTRLHTKALHAQGISPIHRKSFAPIRKISA